MSARRARVLQLNREPIRPAAVQRQALAESVEIDWGERPLVRFKACNSTLGSIELNVESIDPDPLHISTAAEHDHP